MSYHVDYYGKPCFISVKSPRLNTVSKTLLFYKIKNQMFQTIPTDLTIFQKKTKECSQECVISRIQQYLTSNQRLVGIQKTQASTTPNEEKT